MTSNPPSSDSSCPLAGSLSSDLHRRIASFLPADDVGALSKTCRSLRQSTSLVHWSSLEPLWYPHTVYPDNSDEAIPLSGFPIVASTPNGACGPVKGLHTVRLRFRWKFLNPSASTTRPIRLLVEKTNFWYIPTGIDRSQVRQVLELEATENCCDTWHNATLNFFPTEEHACHVIWLEAVPDSGIELLGYPVLSTFIYSDQEGNRTETALTIDRVLQNTLDSHHLREMLLTRLHPEQYYQHGKLFYSDFVPWFLSMLRAMHCGRVDDDSSIPDDLFRAPLLSPQHYSDMERLMFLTREVAALLLCRPVMQQLRLQSLQLRWVETHQTLQFGLRRSQALQTQKSDLQFRIADNRVQEYLESPMVQCICSLLPILNAHFQERHRQTLQDRQLLAEVDQQLLEQLAVNRKLERALVSLEARRKAQLAVLQQEKFSFADAYIVLNE